METRSLPIAFELKAVEGRTIEGYAAAWARDRVNDIIDVKAFDRTLQDNPDVAVFVGHDSTRLPVGEPAEMRADAHGLFTRTLIYNTADGNALLEVARKRLKNGRSLGMSIGFRTVKDRWDSKQKARIIEDLDLVEYSFLASPALAANPQAFTLGVKSETGALEAIPDELQDEVRALIEEFVSESKPYRIEKRDGKYCVVGGASGSREFGCHASRAEALAQMRALYANAPDTSGGKTAVPPPETRADWTTTYIANLPDSAFAYIEPGGTKDDDGKTTPRSLRHYPHHNADGELDLPHLRNALVRAEQNPSTGDKALPHLERHARAEGIGDQRDGEKSLRDDAHEPVWAEGAAPTLLVLARKIRALAEDAADDRLAMERLGMDTKSGARLNRELRLTLKQVHDALSQILAQADEIERGDDGAALVDTFRTAFALLDLEEVA